VSSQPNGVIGPVDEMLARVHESLLARTDGEVATYIPELAMAPADAFGISLATLDGHVYETGDSRHAFTIQSVSKPFVYALALADRGLEAVLGKIGVEPTGNPFNSITVDPETGRPYNPMVNAGAIVAASLVNGRDADDRFERIRGSLSTFAGRPTRYIHSPA
jgi:glutaminase